MLNMSELYKLSMDKRLRNQSYLTVNIGVINQQAQSAAYIENIEDGLYLASGKIFSINTRKFYYATFEQDFVKANGKMLFPTEESVLNITNGYISDGLLSEGDQFIIIRFQDISEVNVKGLTITFAEYFPPTSFEISTNNDVLLVEHNTARTYITDHVFENAQWIKIKAIAMKNQNLRLRIENVVFGLGIIFNNDNIQSATYKSYVSPVSDNVPQLDFTVTVDNTEGVYTIENEESTMNFLESGQELDIQYGYELDNGKIETIQLGTMKLKSWEATKSYAKFTAVDLLELHNDVYYKGKYYENGISLYQLAVDVLTDMGLGESNYSIDPYLKTVTINNPIPLVKHKEALQLIANCGRCAYSIDNESRIIMKSVFVPELSIYGYTEHRLSTTTNVLTNNETSKYAFFDSNITSVDGTFKFAPETGIVTDSVFISEEIANDIGEFTTKPYIDINLEAAYSSVGAVIEFEGTLPGQFTVETFYEENQIDTLIITDISMATTINNKFSDFNRMRITIDAMSEGNSRARIKHFEFGEFTDYVIYEEDMISEMKGKQLDKVRDVTVEQTIYSPSTEERKKLADGTSVINSSKNVITVTFSKASYDYEVFCDSYPYEITESGVFYVVLTFEGLSEKDTIVSYTVTGKEYVITTSTFNKSINTRGYSRTWRNPLVSDHKVANDLLAWISDYYASDREYNVAFRGNPAIESSDLLYLETSHGTNTKCRLYESTLTFNGAIKQSIKARREVDV